TQQCRIGTAQMVRGPFLKARYRLWERNDAPRQPPFSTRSHLAPHSPLPPKGILTEVCAASTPLPALGVRGQEALRLLGAHVYGDVQPHPSFGQRYGPECYYPEQCS